MENEFLMALRLLVAQLKTYQSMKDTELVRRDLRGYQYMLDKGDPELARRFFEAKHGALYAGKRFKDNIAVLDGEKVDMGAESEKEG